MIDFMLTKSLLKAHVQYFAFMESWKSTAGEAMCF